LRPVFVNFGEALDVWLCHQRHSPVFCVLSPVTGGGDCWLQVAWSVAFCTRMSLVFFQRLEAEHLVYLDLFL